MRPRAPKIMCLHCSCETLAAERRDANANVNVRRPSTASGSGPRLRLINRLFTGRPRK